MLENSIYIVIGFGLLLWGADRFVLGAAATARNLGVSPLIIGLTIVGFGTSAPEILISGNHPKYQDDLSGSASPWASSAAAYRSAMSGAGQSAETGTAIAAGCNRSRAGSECKLHSDTSS